MRTSPCIADVANLFLVSAALIGILFLIGCAKSSTATPTFTVGGAVSGLTGTGLVLQDNGGNNLSVTANGTFTFTTALANGAAYSVTAFSQPTSPSQNCTVTSGGGTVGTSNVTNVSVTCVTDTFTIGGTVSGLAGSGLVLQDNGGNNLTVPAALPGAVSAPFSFTTALASGAVFSVTVLTQPSTPTQTCGVTGGGGTVTTAAITSVAVSCTPTTTFLTVSDNDNNRVLVYDVPFSTAQSANVVLGQANFTTATAGATASTMNAPVAAAVDVSGNLYVADNRNCRVIQFLPPFSNGMNASMVFGQANLTTANCAAATSASTLGNSTNANNVPEQEVFGVTLDSSSDLWVADAANNRVLKYLTPFTSGMAATLAIGQPNLTSGSVNQGGAAPTSATLAQPAYPRFDRSGNLWISDLTNNRLLEFTAPFSTGMTASLVLGQANFTQGAANQGGSVAANTLSSPAGSAFDSSGNLWIADSGNNRVLEFQPPFTSGQSAALVLGQQDFTHNQGNPAPTGATLAIPLQVAFDVNGRLFVADVGNNRTLVFVPPFSNGMNASLVIGEANLTSAAAATTATGQSSPTGVTTGPPLY